LAHHPKIIIIIIIIKKKLKLWRLPNIAISICEERMPSLWFIYIGEKGKTLGKGYGTK
jgi:hypothetical protein